MTASRQPNICKTVNYKITFSFALLFLGFHFFSISADCIAQNLFYGDEIIVYKVSDSAGYKGILRAKYSDTIGVYSLKKGLTYFDVNDITKVYKYQKSTANNVGNGLAIGAIVGSIVGLIVQVTFLSDDSDIDGDMTGIVLFAATGATVGVIIGSIAPEKKQVPTSTFRNIPDRRPNENSGIGGLGIQLSYKFDIF